LNKGLSVKNALVLFVIETEADFIAGDARGKAGNGPEDTGADDWGTEADFEGTETGLVGVKISTDACLFSGI